MLTALPAVAAQFPSLRAQEQTCKLTSFADFMLRSLKCESGSTSFSTLMRIAPVPSVHSASRNYLSVFRGSSWSAPR